MLFSSLVIIMQLDKIGKFIAQLRKEKNLTQKELVDIINIDNKVISKWENGKYAPDITYLKALCTVLGVSLNELLDGKKYEKEENSSEATINGLNFYTKQTKIKCTKIAICIISILSIVFITTFGIIKYNEWHIKSLEATNSEIFNAQGMVLYNSEKSIYIFNEFEYRQEYVGTIMEPIVDRIDVVVSLNEEVISISTIEFLNKIPMHEALQNVTITLEETEYIYTEKETVEININYIDSNTNKENSFKLKLK